MSERKVNIWGGQLDSLELPGLYFNKTDESQENRERKIRRPLSDRQKFLFLRSRRIWWCCYCRSHHHYYYYYYSGSTQRERTQSVYIYIYEYVCVLSYLRKGSISLDLITRSSFFFLPVCLSVSLCQPVAQLVKHLSRSLLRYNTTNSTRLDLVALSHIGGGVRGQAPLSSSSSKVLILLLLLPFCLKLTNTIKAKPVGL